MALSDEIKAARRKRRLTQKQLAARISVVDTTISLYENGERQPSLDVLVQISAVLDVSLDVLLKHELQQLTHLTKDVDT